MRFKSILTILLAFVAMAGQARKTIVWESPSVAYSAIPYFQIQKVEMTKEKTAMYVRMALLPGYGFRISEDSYLQTNGKFSTKIMYQVMDPAGGGRYVNFNFSKTRGVSVLRLVTPYNGPLL